MYRIRRINSNTIKGLYIHVKKHNIQNKTWKQECNLFSSEWFLFKEKIRKMAKKNENITIKHTTNNKKMKMMKKNETHEVKRENSVRLTRNKLNKYV